MTVLPEVRELVVAAAERRATPNRRWWRTPIRVTLLGCGALLAAGTALAATDVWDPIWGRPELADTPQSISQSPVPPATLATLGVLRRPQTSRDRSPTARALLRHAGIEMAGVRPQSVRVVALADGREIVIYSLEKTVDPGTGATDIAEPVCVLFPSGGTCASRKVIASRGLSMTAGPRMLGVVPDGVATVEFTYTDGQVGRATVTDNLFVSTREPVERQDGTPAPPPRRVTVDPSTTRWLNRQGAVVGPQPASPRPSTTSSPSTNASPPTAAPKSSSARG